MKILYLTHRMPYPPNKGDKLRALRQIKRLSRNHSVTVACFVDDPRDMHHMADLLQHCASVVAIPIHRSVANVRGLLGMCAGSTITESFYRSRAMRRAIAELCRETRFDIVVAFSSCMAPYALNAPADRHVLDLCDRDSAKWLEYAGFSHGPSRWLYRWEARRLAAREQEWLSTFDASILISRAEAAGLEQDDRRNLHFVTNGVEIPVRGLRGPDEDAEGPPRPLTIGFVGVMDYFPNVDAVCWFVRSVWPAIRSAFPEARFRIIGRSPASRVRKLAQVPGVTVTGEVENVSSELANLDISVAPLRMARGLQNKVLEAMAAGVAVVLTSKAAEGIDATHGREFLIADAAQDFAEAVVRLAEMPRRRAEMAATGRRFVATSHRWSDALDRFELVVTGASHPKTHASTQLLPIELTPVPQPVEAS